MTVEMTNNTDTSSLAPTGDQSVSGLNQWLYGSLRQHTSLAEFMSHLPSDLGSTATADTVANRSARSTSIDSQFSVLLELIDSALFHGLTGSNETYFAVSDPQPVRDDWIADLQNSSARESHDGFELPDFE